MTIPVKIECSCGQRYAFDVEPVDGRMPAPVACPACGADGTAAANTVISQSAPAAPPVAAAAPGPMRVRVAMPKAAPLAAPPPLAAEAATGHRGRSQADDEARAKIFWGEAPEQVLQHLIMRGFNRADA